MFRPTAFWILLATAGLVGCVDRSPPPPRVAVPQDSSEGPRRESDPRKPMPGELAGSVPPPPAFDDVAMIDQEMPERQAFLQAYERVGRPLIRVDNARPEADNSENTAVILQTIEWLRANGRVAVVTPGAQNPQADVAVLLAIDVLRDQNNTIESVRIAAVAKNTRDELLLGQALVDMPRPIDRQAINRYTRFLARKLMADLTGSWENLPAAARVEPAVPPPAQEPAPPMPPEQPASRPS